MERRVAKIAMILLSVTTISETGWVHKIRLPALGPNEDGYNTKGVIPVDLKKKSYTFELKNSMVVLAYGSVTDSCTAEISCNRLQFPPPDEATQECSNGYILLEDSFGSQHFGCGSIEFGAPIRPSRNGRDLYVKVNGSSPGTVCTVRCGESQARALTEFVKLTTNERHSGQFVTRRCTCGRKGTGTEDTESRQTDHVIGGNKNAVEFSWPWMATLVPKGTSQNRCGASLINDFYLVTAAQCLIGHEPHDFEILLHAHLMDLRKCTSFDENAAAGSRGYIGSVKGYSLANVTDEMEQRIRIQVSAFIIHPLFEKHNVTIEGGWPVFNHDIALVKLQRRVNFLNGEGKLVNPVCLQSAESTVDDLLPSSMTVTGWGKHAAYAGAYDRLLQEVQVDLQKQQACKNFTGDLWNEALICAVFPEGHSVSCQGDYGSPGVIRMDKNHFVQVGTVSWAGGCWMSGQVGVYSSLLEMHEWIHRNTHDAVWCKSPNDEKEEKQD